MKISPSAEEVGEKGLSGPLGSERARCLERRGVTIAWLQQSLGNPIREPHWTGLASELTAWGKTALSLGDICPYDVLSAQVDHSLQAVAGAEGGGFLSLSPLPVVLYYDL